MAQTLTQAAVEKLKPIAGKRRVIRDGASTALFLVIQPTGHKSWMMRFRRGEGAAKIFLGPLDVSRRHDGGEPQVGQPLTLIEARRLAARINSERASGRDVVADHRAKKHRQRVAVVEAAANSFSVAAKDFIREYAQPKVRGWKELASNLGLDAAELSVKPGGLADRWNDRDVRTVDASDLYSVVEESRRFATPGIAARHEKPSKSRARKLFAALSQLYTWLLRTRRVTVDPTATLHAPAAPPSRDRVLSTVEIKSFWAATDALPQPFGDALKLLLITGCRRDEIAKLRWDELTDGSSITIPGSRTKNHLAFVIPLPPLARAIIARQTRDGVFVFSTTGGVAPISGWSKAKTKIDNIMGGAVAWVVHDLRRTCATHMAEIGIAPHIVEAALNHISGFRASVAGTYNRAAYAAEKKEALERWEARLQSIVR